MKKILYTLLLTLLTVASFATNRYISNAGNDASAGTSTGTAWRTIAKLNASWGSILPGDTIFFRKGDTWNEGIVFGKSGTSGHPIVISSYGSGAAPVITGYQTLTGFSSVGNVYTKIFSAGKQNFINLEFDGVMQRFARTPNTGVTPYYYEAVTTPTTTTTTITDNQLPSIPGMDTGEVVARKAEWAWERGKVTGISGNSITYGLTGNNVNGSAGRFFGVVAGAGWGYLLQNIPSALDQTGEFYFQKYSKALSIYSSDAITNHTVRASAIDRLIDLKGNSYITIENLYLEGANISAIYSVNGSNVKIEGNTIRNSGAIGLQFTNVNTLFIVANDIDWSLSTGIQANGNTVTVLANIVDHTFQYEGMGDYGSDGSCLRGIVSRGNGNTIKNNIVLNSGYSGINFQGSNVLVYENYVEDACQIQRDNANIYTYVGDENSYGPPATPYTNRTIRKNILVNTQRNPSYGGKSSEVLISGVYTDGKSPNVHIDSNTFIGFTRAGITSNNPTNFVIKSNTFYHDSMGMRRLTRRNYDKQFLENYEAKQNIFVPEFDGQVNIYYFSDSLYFASTEDEVAKLIKADSNYTIPNSMLYRADISIVSQPANRRAPYSLNGFQLATGEESHTLPIKTFKPYTITSQGTNKFPNPFFTTNISSIVTYSATASWDNTNQITNGTYKIAFSTTTPESYSSTFAPVGSVSGKYLVRFKTKGTQNNGLFKIFFATTAAPTVPITPLQWGNFGTSVKQHEFYVETPAANANFAINFDRSSGTTYLDDVEVIPFTGTANNLSDSLKFVYSTGDTVFVSLAYKYKDVYGKVYNGGQDTVLPYTSRLYIYESAVDGTPNIPPVVNAGTNKQVKLPINQATFTGTATDDVSVSSVSWNKVSGPSGTFGTPTALSTTFTGTTVGTYVLQFSAIDDQGAVSSDTTTLVITAANVTPSVNAGTDQTIQLPAGVTLSGSATDGDGSVSSYLWTKVSGGSATITSPTSSTTTVTGLSAGTYIFQLTATDNEGGQGIDQVTVTVLSANLPPIANAGVDKSITLPTNTVQLIGSGSDPDGTILDYFWTKISGGAATFADPNASTLSLSGLVQGTYVFQLTVTDNQGLTGTDQVTVIVNAAPPAANQLPVVSAGADKNLRLPINFTTLTGSSSDPDGTITSRQWTRVSGPNTPIMSGTTSNSLILFGLVQGTYVFSFRATDNRGGSSIDYVTVYVQKSRITTLTTSYKFVNK